MAEMTQNLNRERLVANGIAGAVGGLIGGIAFGILMGMMGMLPMIAGMVGSSSVVVGFIVHMAISVFIGVTFGLIFGWRSRTYLSGIGWGLFFGLIWWVLGPIVLMPMMMGMGLQFAAAFTSPMLMSLMGHLLYGALTGLGFAWYSQR